MSRAEEMFATMSVSGDTSTYLAEEEPHIVINESRQAIVPNELKTIAVTGDKDIETVTFDCVRYWDGHDLSTFAIYLNYVLPDLTTGTYIPEKITTTDGDEFYHFDWQIKNNITVKSGKISFAVTAVKTKQNKNGETVVDKQWSSLPNGDCSIALGIDISNIPSEEDSSEVLAQMSAILEQIQLDIDEWIEDVVAQTTGDSETKVMSQKATTEGIAFVEENTSKQVGEVANFSSNLVNPDNVQSGYISYGKFVENEDYTSSDFIRLKPNTDYVMYVPSASKLGSLKGFVYLYDAKKDYIRHILCTSLDGYQWFTFNSGDKIFTFCRFSIGTNETTNMYLGEGNQALVNIPKFGFELSPHGSVDYSQIKNAPEATNYDYKSALTGKVWYALGDSATAGDGATYLTDGIYVGKKAVYPYFIGNRTGMVVHNLAVNGAVMATIKDQPDRYQWSVNGNYDSVGDDADFITIWIGANDMWQKVPIGTIDSEDDTTFYGAYNKVLTYYVNNFPKTKLGIVASFWCTQAYAEAVIAIGAKYGVPVLNLYNDPKIPVTVGSKRPDVSDEVKTLRNNQWVVSSSNSHPSSEYHEIESYFIEEWLKTL